ncbi:MAG: Glutamate 5-kinase [Elusimicrobia bacterium]|nr:Glutamate 5-kinase [Elusimicrobiota bacterium]
MRLVIKTGSATLSKKNGGLDAKAIGRIAKQLAYAHKRGHDVIVVSSGAIAAGVGRLKLKERPKELQAKQATAAVGQVALMHEYEKALSKYGIIPAQLLLTREDLMNRKRYTNVRHTLLHLLSHRTMPIINENDSVSTDEIQFGDNDSLSSIVAVKVRADKLILLSDVPGLFEQDSRGRLTNRVIPLVKRVTASMEKKADINSGSKLSVGGIKTKLAAAKRATSSGIETWIASGTAPDTIEKILNDVTGAGTRFLARLS